VRRLGAGAAPGGPDDVLLQLELFQLSGYLLQGHEQLLVLGAETNLAIRHLEKGDILREINAGAKY
jgi:hypothetical protein